MDNADESARRQKLIAKIQEFCLFDDDFMSKVFEDDKEATELLLSIILDRRDLTVIESKGQVVVKNLQGRSVRLDIKAKDTCGRLYNIEVQRSDGGADERRARYYSAILDANTLLPKQDFAALPETYVIFITEHDVLGENLPLYTISRAVEQSGSRFADGTHIIYVNGERRDDTALGRLMQDFFCKNPDDMHYQLLADRTRYYKKADEGVQKMCKIMDDIKKEGLAEGRETAQLEFATKLLRSEHMSYAKVAQLSSLSEEQVRQLAETVLA